MCSVDVWVASSGRFSFLQYHRGDRVYFCMPAQFQGISPLPCRIAGTHQLLVSVEIVVLPLNWIGFAALVKTVALS